MDYGDQVAPHRKSGVDSVIHKYCFIGLDDNVAESVLGFRLQLCCSGKFDDDGPEQVTRDPVYQIHGAQSGGQQTKVR